MSSRVRPPTADPQAPPRRGPQPGAPRRPDLSALRAELPPQLGAAADEFERHLALERNRSVHTVRAYLGDVVGFLDHLARLGGTRPGAIDLARLRGWLGIQRSRGASRATMARRSASLRTFCAWAKQAGLLDHDPGQLLASPKTHRVLPSVLHQDEADRLMDVGAAGADNGEALATPAPTTPAPTTPAPTTPAPTTPAPTTPAPTTPAPTAALRSARATMRLRARTRR